MFIKNYSVSINSKNAFPCKSTKLLKFLTENKGLMYIAKTIDERDSRSIWLFVRTDSLAEALTEWHTNKETGNLAFK